MTPELVDRHAEAHQVISKNSIVLTMMLICTDAAEEAALRSLIVETKLTDSRGVSQER